MSDIDGRTVVVVVGLALITVLARGFFLMSGKAWSLPHWAQRGLQYAPIAALAKLLSAGDGGMSDRPLRGQPG